MIALAVATVITVQPGNTLSGIASAHGESLSQIEADNPQITNPNYIYAGEQVNLSSQPGVTDIPVAQQPGYQAPAPVQQSTPAASGGGLGDIPGMPSGLAHCIAYRESTNDTNPAAGGNAYGIIPASGYNVSGDSLAQQNQVAGEIYARSGGAAWAADGCPGT